MLKVKLIEDFDIILTNDEVFHIDEFDYIPVVGDRVEVNVVEEHFVVSKYVPPIMYIFSSLIKRKEEAI